MTHSSLLRLTAAAALGLSALVATPAQAAFSNLVIFGDSLSDTGNAGLALEFGPPSVPNASQGLLQPIDNNYIPVAPYPITGGYPFATLTNGPSWAWHFADMLGLAAMPSLAGGTNYSYAGARISFGIGAGFDVPSLQEQMRLFLDGLSGPADPNALYIVGGGGNDARDGITAALTDIFVNGSDPAAATFNAAVAAAASYAAGVEFIVHGLQAAGANHILVFNTPNVGLIPALNGRGLYDMGEAISGAMNGALAAQLADDGVGIFDAFSFVGQLASPANPLGLVNTTDACGGIPGADCSKYLFWDGIHPTARVHEAIADAVYAQAVPEPRTYALMALGLVAVGFAARRRRAA